jgi:hypothetical protein
MPEDREERREERDERKEAREKVKGQRLKGNAFQGPSLLLSPFNFYL